MKFHSKNLLAVATAGILATAQAQCSKLIWSDEFEGNALDQTKWTNMVGDGCDYGESNHMCGWGNAESQIYTAGDENLEVSDGTLKIYAKYEPSTNRYTSARLRSLGKADFDLSKGNYRLEARAKVPKGGRGLWPAFWMMPSNTAMNQWPLGGEIDILEYIGKEPNSTQSYYHYGAKWGDKSQKGTLLKHPQNAGDQFHVFAIEKRPYSMTALLDGQPFHTFKAEDVEPKYQWPFEATYHFILNLAIGGHWPGYPDETTVFPNTFEIDYVRVYDLGDNPQPTFRMQGDSLVRRNARNVQYCIRLGSLQPNTDYGTDIEWTVPPDATITTRSATPLCATVRFGTQSGYVQAKIPLTCPQPLSTGGAHYEVKMPVEVQDYYGKEYPLITPDFNQDRASYVFSTGNYDAIEPSQESGSPATIVYQRALQEVYDVILLETDVITDPELFVQAARKFYLDAMSITAAPCTRFWIQLEDSSVATLDNYPAGRHSRYISFLQKDTEFQRLEFDFYDKIDLSTQKVDRIVLLIDSFQQRSDVYYLRNLVTAAAGCDNQSTLCEPLSTNTCQTAAKSEQGACTDGFNNDGFGYNGDLSMDCDDSDCWGLDPACMAGVPEPTQTKPAAPGPAPTTASLPAVDPSPMPSTSQATSPGSTEEALDMRKCSAHPACAHLENLCCPTVDDIILACCNMEDSLIQSTKALESLAFTSNVKKEATAAKSSKDVPVEVDASVGVSLSVSSSFSRGASVPLVAAISAILGLVMLP